MLCVVYDSPGSQFNNNDTSTHSIRSYILKFDRSIYLSEHRTPSPDRVVLFVLFMGEQYIDEVKIIKFEMFD